MRGYQERDVKPVAGGHAAHCSHAFEDLVDPILAEDIRSAAAEILEQNAACYLTISLNLDPEQAPVLRLLDGQWNTLGSLQTGYDVIADWLRDELGDLLESLAEAWPPYALTQPLGLMCDGSGLAFSPDLPCPDDRDWAGKILTTEARLIEIVKFEKGSSWSLLSSPPRATSLH